VGLPTVTRGGQWHLHADGADGDALVLEAVDEVMVRLRVGQRERREDGSLRRAQHRTTHAEDTSLGEQARCRVASMQHERCTCYLV
jgi:hypothetical protein